MSPEPLPPLPAEDMTAPVAESTTVSSVGERPCFTRLIIFSHSEVFSFSYHTSFSYTEVVGTCAEYTLFSTSMPIIDWARPRMPAAE